MRILQQGFSHLGIRLSSRQITQFQRYSDELSCWRQRVNLTTISEPHDIEVRHFLDSLTGCLAMSSKLFECGKLIDVGSGAGFPGLPLKIAFPDLSVVLVESVGKKAAFLNHIVDVLGLENINVVSERAETLAHDSFFRHKFDIAVARAVGHMSTIVEITLPFCKTGGRLIAYKKGDVDMEIGESIASAKLLGGILIEQRKVDLPELHDDRYLVVFEKIEETLSKYPRRPGIPHKRPL